MAIEVPGIKTDVITWKGIFLSRKMDINGEGVVVSMKVTMVVDMMVVA